MKFMLIKYLYFVCMFYSYLKFLLFADKIYLYKTIGVANVPRVSAV